MADSTSPLVPVTYGTGTVLVPSDLQPPPEAGQLTVSQVQALSKPWHGLGRACDDAADSIEKAGGQLALPAGLTPERLRSQGSRAERIDQVVADLEVLLGRLKQANLLFDDEAFRDLRRVYDGVKSQSKYNPELETMFASLFAYFDKR